VAGKVVQKVSGVPSINTRDTGTYGNLAFDTQWLALFGLDCLAIKLVISLSMCAINGRSK